jgi:hypothetical protein
LISFSASFGFLKIPAIKAGSAQSKQHPGGSCQTMAQAKSLKKQARFARSGGISKARFF